MVSWRTPAGAFFWMLFPSISVPISLRYGPALSSSKTFKSLKGLISLSASLYLVFQICTTSLDSAEDPSKAKPVQWVKVTLCPPSWHFIAMRSSRETTNSARVLINNIHHISIHDQSGQQDDICNHVKYFVHSDRREDGNPKLVTWLSACSRKGLPHVGCPVPVSRNTLSCGYLAFAGCYVNWTLLQAILQSILCVLDEHPMTGRWYRSRALKASPRRNRDMPIVSATLSHPARRRTRGGSRAWR
jgi:hypothetical protein